MLAMAGTASGACSHSPTTFIIRRRSIDFWETMKKRKRDSPKPEWQLRSEAIERRLRELAEKGQAELDRRKREASA
jgi:hypothetical protein